jgi:DNA polymerase III delta prime subunit
MEEKKTIKTLWVEKYRPSTLDDMILTPELRRFFEDKREKGDMDGNVLLVGNAGIGKTTLAKLIPNYILGCQKLYINASDENGIDTIRTKVTRFVRTKSIDGKKKVVILDEADGLSKSSQQALRNVIEENNDNSVFVLTANYLNKIIEPIRSRCPEYNLNYTVKEYITYIVDILNKEHVKILGDPADLGAFIKGCFPDFRKCINRLQKATINGELNVESAQAEYNSFAKDVWNSLLDADVNVTRNFIIKNEVKFDNDYHYLGVMLFNYICSNDELSDGNKSIAIQKIGEALRSHPHISDAEINLFSKLIELRTLIQS